MPELFQVVKDPAPENSGGIPIFCHNHAAWLGSGVYFWESFIENARQYGAKHCQEWGKDHGTKGYAIYRVFVDYADRCFNLVDGVEDLKFIKKFYDGLQNKNHKGRPIRLFELLRIMLTDPEFKKEYDCVRAKPDGGGLVPKPSLEYTLPNARDRALFFFTPPIQVCYWQNAPKKNNLTFVE
ncbi:hypothetical protein [uncultured Fibrobacter sp.]|uniref:hypothetical protein n=1 Tax=uncultured Fibrobacter sp. TaxID=261512 RepID=UPI0025D0AEDF|nr:hypothetical protein [uncultured Fibrobacter sp.]